MTSNAIISSHGGEILATGVSFEEYLDQYAGIHCELVEGNVIKMSPASLRHQNLQVYCVSLLGSYFELRPIGVVVPQPFVQRLGATQPKREPDVLIVLNQNLERLKETYLDGPADICIEIGSRGTEDIDRGDKFLEYEAGGVQEYWLFDTLRSEALFYRLNSDGIYEPQSIDTNGYYRSPLLPGLLIHVPTLWKVPLPGTGAIVRSVEAMLK